MPEVYTAEGDVLVPMSPRAKPIRLTENFILACHDPLMSFRNSPIYYPSGPSYNFFQAVRIEKPITVMNVISSSYDGSDDYYDRMHDDFDASPHSNKEAPTLPEGSLLLRRFNVAAGKTEGEWFALTPEQEGWQNLQRVHLPYDDDGANVSCAHSLSFMMSVVSSWKRDAQRSAQMDDIMLLQKIKNKKSFVGRFINFLTF